MGQQRMQRTRTMFRMRQDNSGNGGRIAVSGVTATSFHDVLWWSFEDVCPGVAEAFALVRTRTVTGIVVVVHSSWADAAAAARLRLLMIASTTTTKTTARISAS